MKIVFTKDLPLLLLVLASLSTLVYLPRVESVWTEMKLVYSEQDFGLSILRGAMLVGLASQDVAQEHLVLDGRIDGGGRMVWKTSESSLSYCCEIHGRYRRQDTGIK